MIMQAQPPRPTERPLQILMSAQSAQRHAARIQAELSGVPHRIVTLEADGMDLDADVAFISRDVTGLSTKHEVLPATQAYYDAMCRCKSLSWVHTHSAGADRSIFTLLRQRGVLVTTSAGANASVVTQSALAGILALARHFPLLARAQQERRWAPLLGTGLPRDMDGQTATIVGWGAIGQYIGQILTCLGMRVVAVRQSVKPSAPALETITFDTLPDVLPRTDWLVLACPLTPVTQGLVDAEALALLPPGACLVNVSRGEVVDEQALCEALAQGRLAGAYLDVFAHEPLAADSPLWDMPNVIVTPHSAGFSDGNGERVVRMFLANLGRRVRNEPLHNLSA